MQTGGNVIDFVEVNLKIFGFILRSILTPEVPYIVRQGQISGLSTALCLNSEGHEDNTRTEPNHETQLFTSVLVLHGLLENCVPAEEVLGPNGPVVLLLLVLVLILLLILLDLLFFLLLLLVLLLVVLFLFLLLFLLLLLLLLIILLMLLLPLVRHLPSPYRPGSSSSSSTSSSSSSTFSSSSPPSSSSSRSCVELSVAANAGLEDAGGRGRLGLAARACPCACRRLPRAGAGAVLGPRVGCP